MDATDILKCCKTAQKQLEGDPEGMDLRKWRCQEILHQKTVKA
jgi:hypothetical protein